MSFFKQRSARTDLSGLPFHPVWGDEPVDDPGDDPGDEPRDPASPSSADIRQPLELPLSELTPPAARQADLVCLADIEPRPIGWLWKDRLAAGALSILSGDRAPEKPGSPSPLPPPSVGDASLPPLPEVAARTPAPACTPPRGTKPPSFSARGLPASRVIPRASSCCAAPSPPALPNPPPNPPL